MPAKYETRTYQKLASDAVAQENTTEPTYTTRSFERLAADATTQASPVEARYETRTYQTMTAPTTEKVAVEPVYKTVSKRVLVSKGGFTEWREVVCEADITPDLYKRIQQALLDRGYNIGSAKPDGVIGPGTKSALVEFQKDNGLPVGNLDFETLRALGVQ